MVELFRSIPTSIVRLKLVVIPQYKKYFQASFYYIKEQYILVSIGM